MKYFAGASALTLLLAACNTSEPVVSTTNFTVRVENVSTEDTLTAAQAVPLSPGAWPVIEGNNALFTSGGTASAGIEAIVEDGNPATIAPDLEGENAAVFNTPVDASEPGPIGPGGQYSFEFQAEPGDRLNFATMFIQSNDWFYAPSAEGVALFDRNEPISGDISDQVLLWDAGTEADEAAGLGSNQAPRQSGPNTGDAGTDASIRLVPEDALEDLSGSVLETTVSSQTENGVTTFTVTLENTSTPTSLTPTFRTAFTRRLHSGYEARRVL